MLNKNGKEIKIMQLNHWIFVTLTECGPLCCFGRLQSRSITKYCLLSIWGCMEEMNIIFLHMAIYTYDDFNNHMVSNM